MLTPMEKEVNAHPMEKVLLVLGQYTSLSLSSYPFGYDWCVCVCVKWLPLSAVGFEPTRSCLQWILSPPP